MPGPAPATPGDTDADAPSASRVLLVVLDGLGDRPVPALDGRTPLEVAATPHLDGLAAAGATATVDVIAPGVPPGSDTGHLALLGFDPHEVYTGRGPFEAFGAGMDVRPGDVALRANFATVDDPDAEAPVVTDRRAGRIAEGTDRLAAVLDGRTFEDTRVDVVASTAHRAAVVLRAREGTGEAAGEGGGPALDPRVSDTDPHAEGAPLAPCEPLADTKAAEHTARVVDAVVRAALEGFAAEGTPANALITRGAGTLSQGLSLADRWGVSAACVAGVGLVRGVARAVGMELVEVEGATGGLDTDYDAKAEAAVAALGTHDLVLLNVKAPDLCGHDGQAGRKVEVFEAIDRALGGADVADGAGLEDTVVVVTGDHATPVVCRAHTGDPLPALVWGPGVLPDDVASFSERACRAGGLGRLRGRDLLPVALDLCGRTDKFGA